jgi:serine/threonine-protein phosphatase 2A regulatory subunit B''
VSYFDGQSGWRAKQERLSACFFSCRDWDRYARSEYARLAMEEEGREDDSAMDIDTMDGWYVSDEQEDDVEIMSAGSTAVNRTVEAPF